MKNVSSIGIVLSICMIMVLSYNCGERAMTGEKLLSQVCNTAQKIRSLERAYEQYYSEINVRKLNEINGRKKHLNDLWKQYTKSLKATHVQINRTKRIKL